MPLVLSGTDGVSGVDGTASNPSYEGTDSNTGIFYPAADTVAIGTGGTEALRVTSTQAIGIGTTSPVTDSITFARGSGRNAQLDLVGNGNTPNTTGLSILQGTDNNAYIYNRANAGIIFGSNNTERARITSGGNVGISNTNPQSLLSVGAVSPGTAEATNKGSIQIQGTGGGSATGGGGLEFKSAASGNGYGFQISCPDLGSANVPLVFCARNDSASWTERARITSGGNLGVGVTAPVEKIDTNGTVKANAFLLDANVSINYDVKLVTTTGDGGTNTVQTYWNNTYGTKAAGGCLGAYSRNGTYFSPGTTISSSIEYTIYGFIGVAP